MHSTRKQPKPIGELAIPGVHRVNTKAIAALAAMENDLFEVRSSNDVVSCKEWAS